MEKEERELTSEEKCVACAYVFKTRGTVREALEEYLKGQGLGEGIENPDNSVKGEFFYWGIRLFILLLSFSFVFLSVTFIKSFIFHNSSAFSIIWYILTGLAALMLFIFVDDKFIE